MTRDAWHYFVCIVAGFLGASLAYLLLGDLEPLYADVSAWVVWFALLFVAVVAMFLYVAWHAVKRP